MTINEAIDSMLRNETDERKLKCLEELGAFLVAEGQDKKINGRKLFELTENLVKEWPEFVTMLVALSYLASVGLHDAEIDPKEVGSIDLSGFMEEE